MNIIQQSIKSVREIIGKLKNTITKDKYLKPEDFLAYKLFAVALTNSGEGL